MSPLIQASDGNFYGTTARGGPANWGTVFKVTPAGVVTTLYSFCSQPNCADGAYPIAALVQGWDGNFYGTTYHGGTSGQCGSSGCGSVFKITPAGFLTTLYSFCSQPNCSDGSEPSAALVLGGDGSFYGITEFGGWTQSCNDSRGCGTVFKITPSGALNTVYQFCSEMNCVDGLMPWGGLMFGRDGYLYGTTVWGGAIGYGTVFRLGGTLTTLHSFSFDDGAQPMASLVLATDGSLYGTTWDGGAPHYGYGTVFKITPSGTFTKLYSFGNGDDGSRPWAALIQATDGNLYGTTSDGGYGSGTVFAITPGGTLTTLYSFFYYEGATPYAALLQASNRQLYGTAASGGQYGYGAVFVLERLRACAICGP